MNAPLNRRRFLGKSAGAALALDLGAAEIAAHRLSAAPEADKQTPHSGRPKKSVMFTMLPERLSLEARFQLAKEVGFEGVEAPPVAEESAANAMRAAAEKAGLPIHSVIYGGWEAPLSSPDPAIVQKGLESARKAMQSAKWLGADDILLVPAIVNAQTRYKDAYARSQKQVRALIPTAEKLGVMILIEEVWNNFLLSPLEFARYIDEFRHPLVQAYFDVGNVVVFGWPEDWIRTLGKRIKKVHLKDFKRSTRQFVALREGDVDWPEVRRAFAEVGFTGFMNTELPGGDEAYLRDVSARVDAILAGN
jgi:L-ribulose-5-phosphate 3-epimerase